MVGMSLQTFRKVPHLVTSLYMGLSDTQLFPLLLRMGIGKIYFVYCSYVNKHCCVATCCCRAVPHSFTTSGPWAGQRTVRLCICLYTAVELVCPQNATSMKDQVPHFNTSSKAGSSCVHTTAHCHTLQRADNHTWKMYNRIYAIRDYH